MAFAHKAFAVAKKAEETQYVKRRKDLKTRLHV
jgi:hypothetical protein